MRALQGYYTINKQGKIYCIDFIASYKNTLETSSPKNGPTQEDLHKTAEMD